MKSRQGSGRNGIIPGRGPAAVSLQKNIKNYFCPVKFPSWRSISNIGLLESGYKYYHTEST
jgi:hypothetical protein